MTTTLVNLNQFKDNFIMKIRMKKNHFLAKKRMIRKNTRNTNEEGKED